MKNNQKMLDAQEMYTKEFSPSEDKYSKVIEFANELYDLEEAHNMFIEPEMEIANNVITRPYREIYYKAAYVAWKAYLEAKKIGGWEGKNEAWEEKNDVLKYVEWEYPNK